MLFAEPSDQSLNSILYSSAFSQTLILLCSTATSATSPTSKWDGIVGSYPTLQAVNPSTTDSSSHPLPSLLISAHQQAQTWLHSHNSVPPPTTPPKPGRLPSFLSHNRSLSASEQLSPPRPRGMTSSDSSRSLPPLPIDPYALPSSPKERKGRRPSFGLSSKPTVARNPALGTEQGKLPPFDVILNFLPEDPTESLQSLLQQTLTLTTGVTPYIMSGPPRKGHLPSNLPVSLIHILPHSPPPPLEKVLESFLLTLLPSLALRTVQRAVQGMVVTRAVWDAEARMEAAHGLLFGGLSCPIPQGANIKGRALLRDWRECTVHECQIPDEYDCVTPTFPVPTSADLRPRPHARASAPAVIEQISPPQKTPDLISDTSSVSEDNSLSSGRVSNEAEPQAWTKKKPAPKEKGFRGWMKEKMGRF